MEEGLVTEYPDWVRLPPVVMHLISQKLKSITDYVRFRVVCPAWRFASHPKPYHLPPQLPWLMIPYVPNWKFTFIGRIDYGMRFFYDLWKSKMHKIYLPETIGKSCCASYRGWLLLVAHKGSELFLLNPLTRPRVDLPPFTAPVFHLWAKEEVNPPFPPTEDLLMSYMGNYIITKVAFSSDLTDPNCLIMVFFQKARGIFFCQVGDARWTEVVLPNDEPMLDDEPGDAAYHNGNFYLLDREAIYVYDLSKHEGVGMCFFKPELHAQYKFFLVGKSGLYLVAVDFFRGGEELEERVQCGSKQRVVMYKIPTNTSDTTLICGENHRYLAVC